MIQSTTTRVLTLLTDAPSNEEDVDNVAQEKKKERMKKIKERKREEEGRKKRIKEQWQGMRLHWVFSQPPHIP